MEKKTITVNSSEKGKRLDKFLVKKFPIFSRSFLQRLIKEEKVTINEKKAPAHTKVKERDSISIELVAPPKISLKADSNIPLDIIFEDKDFLILNKPSGIVVHPSLSNPNKTLINGVLAYLPEISSVGEDPVRPGIVHRLDKEVSGIMVIAKSQKFFLHLKKQFRNRTIAKKYIALVHGIITPSSGKIDLNIGRSKRKPYRMSVKQKSGGRFALTYYQTLKKFTKYTLLEIKTKTGRTHQIRVHLHALGYPIVGDRVYKIKRVKLDKDLNRIFLHASSIKFFDLQKKKREFHVQLPKALSQYMIKLNRSR